MNAAQHSLKDVAAHDATETEYAVDEAENLFFDVSKIHSPSTDSIQFLNDALSREDFPL